MLKKCKMVLLLKPEARGALQLTETTHYTQPCLVPLLLYLRDDVEVGHQGTLQNDGNVGGVEQLDGVRRLLASVTSRLDGQVHTESLGHT